MAALRLIVSLKAQRTQVLNQSLKINSCELSLFAYECSTSEPFRHIKSHGLALWSVQLTALRSFWVGPA